MEEKKDRFEIINWKLRLHNLVGGYEVKWRKAKKLAVVGDETQDLLA